MNNQEKLDKAIELLREVSRSMEGERGIGILFYPKTLGSFDEIIEDLALIVLDDNNKSN